MDIIKDILTTVFSPYLFWMAYFSKDSPDRDEKISKYIREWFLGGAGIFFIVGLIGNLIFGEDSEAFYFTLFLGVFIAIGNIVLTFYCGWSAHRRHFNKKWDENVDKVSAWFKEQLHEAFEQVLKDIENEQSHQQNSNHNQEYEEQYDDTYQKSREEFFNENYADTDDIGKVLERFNLPKETTDIKIIKKRYRELAKKYHPDMENGDAELFKQLVADFEYIKYQFERKSA